MFLLIPDVPSVVCIVVASVDASVDPYVVSSVIMVLSILVASVQQHEAYKESVTLYVFVEL